MVLLDLQNVKVYCSISVPCLAAELAQTLLAEGRSRTSGYAFVLHVSGHCHEGIAAQVMYVRQPTDSISTALFHLTEQQLPRSVSSAEHSWMAAKWY